MGIPLGRLEIVRKTRPWSHPTPMGNPDRTKKPKPDSKRSDPLQEARTIELAPSDYQPSKAELEEEIPLPGASVEEVRRAFFRPFKIRRRDPKRD